MRTLILLLLNCCISQTLLAQSLTGIIQNDQNEPIIGVYVINEKTNAHAHSDANGKFVLTEFNLGDSLRFSHVAHADKTVRIESNKSLTIILKPERYMLEAYSIRPQIDALNIMANVSLKTNPVRSSQEIMRKVPGLFIGQHAGGGKAEQLFLRGFDIDHGTDVRITVDGMPVNMVSHAHGQGYADAHFIMPELIEKISFGKGPYYAEQGNFNTAGYIDFRLKKRLKNNTLKIEGGQFATQRLFGAFDLVNNNTQNAYVAMEHIQSDGPFESPQNFGRANVLASFNQRLSDGSQFGFNASHFMSSWDASGQIPNRAVLDGSISRFGAIDDTEGGRTARSNMQLAYKKLINEESYLVTKAYYSHYDFTLYSNFTFFLEDSINGDQIKQHENRTVYGARTEFTHSLDKWALEGLLKIGASLRVDNIRDNELSRTKNRNEILERIQFGDIVEQNTAAYSNITLNFGRWTLNPALRLDYFQFNYRDQLKESYDVVSKSAVQFSPKLNILFNPSDELQIYLKGGKGFHSNDARTVSNDQSLPILTAAYGSDLGLIWKPSPQVILNAAYWYLFLEQEFVYVGDAGIVEAGGSTARRGIDLGVRYQPKPWLFINGDINYNHARALQVESNANRIPLAPDFTATLGINFDQANGFIGGLNARHLSDRPANEDNSIIAEGYSILDANMAYQWEHLTLGISVENILNVVWNETQFATTSRLENEQAPVEEIHFTPGTPRFAKATLTYRF